MSTITTAIADELSEQGLNVTYTRQDQILVTTNVKDIVLVIGNVKPSLYHLMTSYIEYILQKDYSVSITYSSPQLLKTYSIHERDFPTQLLNEIKRLANDINTK